MVVVTIGAADEKITEAVKGTNGKRVSILSAAESFPGIMKKLNLTKGMDFRTEYLPDRADHCVVIIHTD